MPSLRTEVEFLEAAGARSLNAGYNVPEEALAPLDEAHRRVATVIAGGLDTVQSLHLEPDADQPGVLAALAKAAHRGNYQGKHHVLAIPVTDAAQHYAAENRYADTTTTPAEARDNLDAGRWKLPEGTLIVVDDADHLEPEQLRNLTDLAADTRTKLLLITHAEPGTTTQERREPPPSRQLTDTLAAHLPWHQHLGADTATAAQQAAPTAIDRARTHLGKPPAPDNPAQPIRRRLASCSSEPTNASTTTSTAANASSLMSTSTVAAAQDSNSDGVACRSD